MNHVQELRNRIRRLPELTETATVVETTRSVRSGLNAAHKKLLSSRAAAVELREIVTQIEAVQLDTEVSKCIEAVRTSADQALNLKSAINKAGGALLPSDVEARVEGIGTAADTAVSSTRRLWNQILQILVRDREPLLQMAERLGISGAAKVSSEMRAVGNRGLPDTPENAARVVACHRQAVQVLDSLPQEGPVGAFLAKLMQGSGAPLTEFLNSEVQEFVTQHGLEERLVVRLAT